MPLRRSEQWFQNQDNELQAAQERAEEIHNRYDRLVLDYAKKDAELQAAREWIKELEAREWLSALVLGDQPEKGQVAITRLAQAAKADHDKLEQQLATAQAEIERLKRDHINQMTELRFFERRLKEIL